MTPGKVLGIGRGEELAKGLAKGLANEHKMRWMRDATGHGTAIDVDTRGG